ncbi:hypothetical protein FAZ15_04450 [Sphingobacterium olei]|uniref:Uncharacterized protein n=1 Tax=Sphingobacterium olei TaxID=2571155 RepID=A0A4U0P511_9SPHI|nr:hypothetical protein FAZ15_04450 [Sphingobacterium olei]
MTYTSWDMTYLIWRKAYFISRERYPSSHFSMHIRPVACKVLYGISTRVVVCCTVLFEKSFLPMVFHIFGSLSTWRKKMVESKANQIRAEPSDEIIQTGMDPVSPPSSKRTQSVNIKQYSYA